MTLISVTTFY